MEANLEELKMQVANLIARVSMAEAQIAEMDDDMPEQPEVVFGGDDSTATAAEYDSLFKAYATTGESLWFGVKDGSGTPLSDDRCGIVRINGTEVDVYSHQVEIESAGSYYAWLFVWMDDVLGRGAEIVINNGGTPVSPVRATPMPSHIVAHGALLIGRLTVDSDMEIESGPTQDYKRGGIPEMLLLGPCGNDVVVELT